MAKRLIRLKKEDITVHRHLQRRLIPSRIKKMSEFWNPDLVGIIQVVEIPGNGYHPTDGQHRVIAAPKGYVFDAVVDEYKSDKQTTGLFLGINQDASRVAALDQYELGIIAEHDKPIATKKALDHVGYRAGENTRGTEIAAVAALMAVTNEGKRRNKTWKRGTQALIMTLNTIDAAWPTEGAQRFHQDMIKSVGYIVARWMWAGNFDHGRLVDKLSGYTPEQWMIMAKETMQSTGGSGGKPSVLQGLMVSRYNSRLGVSRKLT